MNPFDWLQAVPLPIVTAISALVRLVWEVSQARGDAQKIDESLMAAAEGVKAALDAHRFPNG